MCTEYFYRIHPSTSFPCILPPPTDTHWPDRTCFAYLFSVFIKKWYFCLFKISSQGVSLWHFHVCMYYNPNYFIPSIFLLSTFVSFLW
jgi:hypothetical protein